MARASGCAGIDHGFVWRAGLASQRPYGFIRLAERYAACRNECADDDERYMWRSVERALCALSDHGARTLSLAGDLGLPADLTRIFVSWLHVETLQYRPGTFTYDVLDKAHGEACRC